MTKKAESSNEYSSAVTSFMRHTEELAERLKIIFYAFIISTITIMILPADLSFLKNPLVFYRPLIARILQTIEEQVLPSDVKLIGLELMAPIQLYMYASFIFGFVITIPVIAYEIYRFVEPALYPEEKKDAYPFAAAFSVLFVTGIVFGYKVLTPYLIWAMLPFFRSVGAEMTISIMDFYSLLFMTTVVTGLIFTFPVFFVLLVKYGVVGTDILATNRKYLYAGLFILACFITPDGGYVGNVLLFVPMAILTELGIFFARRYEKKGIVRQIRWSSKDTKCKFCGRYIPADTIFCPQCGRSQK